MEWRVTSGRSRNDRIAGDLSLIQLCTWPHFRMSYGRASILLSLLISLPSSGETVVIIGSSCPPTDTSHPRFWRWLTVTTSAKRPSLLSRSIFPAGRRCAAAVYRPTFKIVSAIRETHLFFCRRQTSLPFLIALLFFLPIVFTFDRGGQCFPFLWIWSLSILLIDLCLPVLSLYNLSAFYFWPPGFCR